MADTSDSATPKVDAAPMEEQKVEASGEIAGAEKTKGEALPDTVTDPAPAQATATENLNAATAESTKETAAPEAAAAAPVSTETQTDETKHAVEKIDTTTKDNTESTDTTKDAVPKKTTLDEFEARLPDILKEIDHDEMWGVRLVTPVSDNIPTQIVLQKFLNANDGDLSKAIDQFKGALKFRKEKKPVELVKKTFNAKKFADLGAVTVYPIKGSAVPEVFTWNLYGNVKGKIEEVFVPLDEYAIRRYP